MSGIRCPMCDNDVHDCVCEDRYGKAAPSSCTSEIPCSTFPNPLCVRFGEGRIIMLTFSDEDGHGVILRDTGEPHLVGQDANMPPEKGVMPEPGEVYLHFTNVESAMALRLTLDEAIAEMLNVEYDERYWDADVSRQIYFDNKWAIDRPDADDEANDMHENVVDELTDNIMRYSG